MHKRIGILGGMSPESTVEYYQYITRAYTERFGDYGYPEILIYSVRFQSYVDWPEQDRWDRVAQGLIEACYVEKTGAIYLINMPGTPTECVKPDKHTFLSWNQQGVQGVKGDQGDKGDKGDKGDPGISGWEIVRGATASSPSATQVTVYATCPAGKKPLGGGGSQGSFGWFVDDTRPNANGWQVQYVRESGLGAGGFIGEAWVICAYVAT